MGKKFGGMPKGGGFPGNMGSMLKQMEKMQSELQRSQDEIQTMVFEEQTGGGAVKISMDGTYTVRSILISPEVIQAGDAEMLQDLVMSAMNALTLRISDQIRDTMKKATGGVQIPGLF